MSQTADLLLEWYDGHARDLPWRYKPGQQADPYRVWLSEIMLQQTTVATVKSYFEKFTSLWPTVADLAAAPQEEVLAAWAGLGYYARARNLHKCAQLVVSDHGGRFPATQAELQALPGIGDYTSAAIASIAFGQSAVVVDGNVERVVSRLDQVTASLPKAKPALKGFAAARTPDKRPGDYAQAMMDLGSGICTPTKPSCLICPLRSLCAAFKHGGEPYAETLPKKEPKKPKPTRLGKVFWIEDPSGRIFLRRRPERGLLGGLLEFPSTDWREGDAGTLCEAPLELDWQRLGPVPRHTFTHFHLDLEVYSAKLDNPARLDNQPGGIWAQISNQEQIEALALPTLMAKVAKACL